MTEGPIELSAATREALRDGAVRFHSIGLTNSQLDVVMDVLGKVVAAAMDETASRAVLKMKEVVRALKAVVEPQPEDVEDAPGGPDPSPEA